MDGRPQRLAEPRSALQRQVEVRAVELQRFAPCHDAPHDLDVLARAGERLGIRLAVPALHDLRA
jgi:hypothetical protein